VDGGLYAWLAVFVLPVNSALNPLVYTLTTRMFKQKFLPRLCVYASRPKQDCIHAVDSSSSSKRSQPKTADVKQNGANNALLSHSSSFPVRFNLSILVPGSTSPLVNYSLAYSGRLGRFNRSRQHYSDTSSSV
jgi:hypothetical protein